MEKKVILYVGDGFYPSTNGGAAQIQLEMIKNCRKMGYEPVIFQSGIFSIRSGLRLKQSVMADGTQVYNVINSGNYPGRRHPELDIDNSAIIEISKKVLDYTRPEVIHIHELTYLCSSFMDLCSKLGIPFVKTIHNYWDLCPQRDMLLDSATPCSDFQEGRRCIACKASWSQNPKVSAIWRHLYGTPLYGLAKGSWHFLQNVGALKATLLNREESERAEGDKNELAQAYRARRQSFVRSLNKAAAVHVYSRRSGMILAENGIEACKIRYIPIVTELIHKLQPKRIREELLPIKFGYRGGLAPHKGLEVLVRAFLKLKSDKAGLAIYGTGSSHYIRVLKQMTKGYNVEFHGGYHPNQLSDINTSIDVGIIPSIWEEVFGLVGLEYLKSGVPVIASNIGGMCEYIVNNKNGIIVKAGDIEELTDAMSKIAYRPSLIREMTAMTSKWITRDEMAERIGALYNEALRH